MPCLCRLDKLGDDLLPLLTGLLGKAGTFFKDIVGSTDLTIGDLKKEVTSDALTFRVSIDGQTLDDMQKMIRDGLDSVLQDDDNSKNISATCEVGLGISVDDLTSQSDAVWLESVYSHIDRG